MPDEFENGENTEVKSIPEPESTRQGDCPICHTENTQIFKCSVCMKEFCTHCKGNHTPPNECNYESKVHFLYKIRGTTAQWKEDIVRFTDTVTTPLCSECWDNECTKMVWRFKWKIKNWKQDMLRDEELKILEETLPACGLQEDKQVVKTALDFLGELQKTQK